ncbi:unnamed protein product [Meganyctiphanes norvegica]|uniref:Alanine--glyoxylate aminotransferase n=1 Tax=Meganyctiphanes norvegica TaxID=48144 RepID=A0AAV2QHT6_MEGNR
MDKNKGKKLFTPGPLCCSSSVKEAMLVDLGSRDILFIDCVKQIRETLLDIAGVTSNDYACVPLQGSGTYSVEAILQTTSPRIGTKILILANGAYGKRMEKMCQYANLEYNIKCFPETQKITADTVNPLLSAGVQYSTVAIVHCETSSGVINQVEEVGKLVKQLQSGAAYFVDAMSSFGAIPLDLMAGGVDYLVSSANKCLEGVPGFAYAICRKNHLISCKGNCRVLSLDLVEQYLNLEATGQFRFTPPTHTMLAFKQALKEYENQGGLQGRAQRYKNNRSILKKGMAKLGFQELLDNEHDGYIITSYFMPKHPNFNFKQFYTKLADKGQVIYPGKVTDAECFRVGNIGHLFPEDMNTLLNCIVEVLEEMDVPMPLQK